MHSQTNRTLAILDELSISRQNRKTLLDSLSRAGYSVGDRQLKRDLKNLVDKMWIFSEQTQSGTVYRRNSAK